MYKDLAVLYKGKRLKVLIDVEDYGRVSQYKWFVYHKIYIARQISSSPQVFQELHRFIMNTPKGMHTDHINGNTLDNRKTNLRICSLAENIRNQVRKTSKSGFKGVTKNHNTWRARIIVNQKEIFLGNFKTPIEASRVYNKAAIRYFGEFANI